MDKVIACLNSLIETSKDGEQGFQACAEQVNDPGLKSVFLAASERCTSGIAELEEEVRRLGGDPDVTGSATGRLMRVWINIKSAVSGIDDSAILCECERGEDFAVKAYEEALQEDLPSFTRTLIERQYRSVAENHAHIRDLRDRYEAAI